MESSDAAPPLAESAAPAMPPAPQPTATDTPIERRPWAQTIAPHYIGLFLWVVFFDRLGVRALPMGGVGWSVLGVAVAALLCERLLYHVPASWGWKTGQPLTMLGTSTFGVDGARWLTGVMMGVAQVVWLAVATYYAVELTFQGLVALRLLDPVYLKTVAFGRLTLKNPLFLLTALAWSFAAAFVGAYLVRVISALMKVFPVFPAGMLAMAMLWTFKGLQGFQPSGLDPVSGAPIADAGYRAFTLVIQLVFGFFATAGALSADWGAVSREMRDVRMGGLIGVGFAPWIIATLALLTVAGSLGLAPAPPGARGISVGLSFHAAVLERIGGRPAGAILLIFGLASLAPTCYASFVFGHRFTAAWPRLSRLHWTVIGTTAAWPLMATGTAERLEAIFGIMGAAFAPLVGAMAADYTRNRGAWPGPRPGVNQAGLVAWAFGFAVGLAPTIAHAWGHGDLPRLQPAAVFAFLTAFVLYRVLATLGAETSAGANTR